MTEPEDVLRQLSMKLDTQMPTLDNLDRYFNGDVALSFLAPEVREATQGRLRPLVVNWAKVIVGAIEERLQVQGFRLGEQTEDDLWRIWQDANLDEFSQMAHEEALVLGRSFVMVWADDEGNPKITVESARQVWVDYVPGTRTRRWGFKRWVGPDNHVHAVLFSPATVYRFKSEGLVTFEDLATEPDLIASTGVNLALVESMPNPMGVVPIVPLVNRPRLMSMLGTSELADVLPLLDGINKLATDMLVGAEFHALPRRWAIGVQIPEERDDQGKPTGKVSVEDVLRVSAGRLLHVEAENAKLGEFPSADLSNFTNAIDSLTTTLAALAALPPHFVGISTANPASADAIRSSEASLVSKCRRKQQAFSGTWEEVMRLAVMVRDGKEDPDLNRLETVWKDPESRTVAAAADAAMKLVAGGLLPVDQALADLGYTPTQIDRMRDMRRPADHPALTTEGTS